jgi:adenosine deaminase
MFKLAERNKIKIAYKSEVEVCAAYKFSNLQEFLNIYYTACEVLVEE